MELDLRPCKNADLDSASRLTEVLKTYILIKQHKIENRDDGWLVWLPLCRCWIYDSFETITGSNVSIGMSVSWFDQVPSTKSGWQNSGRHSEVESFNWSSTRHVAGFTDVQHARSPAVRRLDTWAVWEMRVSYRNLDCCGGWVQRLPFFSYFPHSEESQRDSCFSQ